jgi:two-component system, response regulator PdtaR
MQQRAGAVMLRQMIGSQEHDSDAPPTPSYDDEDSQSDQRATILVVEGDVLVRIAICEHLRDAGYRVIEAGTAEDARRRLETGTRPNIVFADIDLPGPWQGTQLLDWLRTEFPKVKVILTSCAFHTLVGAGCDLFIPKPYLARDVETRVRRLLDA